MLKHSLETLQHACIAEDQPLDAARNAAVWVGDERVHCAHKDKAYDTTRYGEFSTHSFYSHHATQISLAIVTSDAEAINSQLSSDESRFAHTGAVGGR